MSGESNEGNTRELLGALRTVVEAASGGELGKIRDSVAELDLALSEAIEKAREETNTALERLKGEVLARVESSSGEAASAVRELEGRLDSRMDRVQQETSDHIGSLRDELATRLDAADREADAAKQQAKTAEREAGAARKEAEAATAGAEFARQEAEAARQQAESARREAEDARREAAAAKEEAADAERVHQQALAEVDSRRAQALESLEGKLEAIGADIDRRIEAAKGTVTKDLAAEFERLDRQMVQMNAVLSSTQEQFEQHKADGVRVAALLDRLSGAFSAVQDRTAPKAAGSEGPRPAEQTARSEQPLAELPKAEREELENALDRAFSTGP